MSTKPNSKFVVKILAEYCKGCGLCVEYCPAGKLEISDKPNRFGVLQARVVSGEICKGCRQCVLMCPDACIEIYRLEKTCKEGSADANCKVRDVENKR